MKRLGLSIMGIWGIMGGLGQMPPAIAANPAHIERLLKSNQCPQCDLSGANLATTNLFGANLTQANLTGANLAGSNLGSANLTQANLTGANLTEAYLQQAILENTNLSGANLTDADLQAGSFIGTVNLSGATLRRAKLSHATLAGINLEDTDLREADLSYAMLSGIRPLSGKRSLGTLISLFTGFSNFFCETSLAGVADSQANEFTQQFGVELAFAKLSRANLAGANLTGAMLASGDLRHTDLRNANLTGACLRDSNLSHAILDGAELQDARLTGSILAETRLNGVKNANLADTYASEAEAKVAGIQHQALEQVRSAALGQYAYFLENQKFAQQWGDVGFGMETETAHYQYVIVATPDQTRGVMLAAVPRQPGYKMYLSFVHETEIVTDGDHLLMTVCESKMAQSVVPPLPPKFPTDRAIACPAGFRSLDESESEAPISLLDTQ